MLRFIDLGKQIGSDDDEWPREFAFFNTVYDTFLTLSGSQVWSSFDELEKDYLDADINEQTRGGVERLRSLCPAWVFEVKEKCHE